MSNPSKMSVDVSTPAADSSSQDPLVKAGQEILNDDADDFPPLRPPRKRALFI